MARVFAFGTLKRGFPLHAEGLASARYLGRYRTVERFPMLIAGPWFAPMMLDLPRTGLQVRGELYEIDETTLCKLDVLESVGKPGNFRKLIQLESIERSDLCLAFAYMKSPDIARPIHSGYLADYQDQRFIPPRQRA